jgi:hypothetical protein
MVGLSGAFGVICLMLFYGSATAVEGQAPPMLNLLLGRQFHLMIGLSGVFLLGLSIIRAVSLWKEAAPAKSTASLPLVDSPHSHQHDHSHGHDHDHHHHEGCGHDHSHDHALHTHEHHHHHDHEHDHSHEDHEHGWAPWRYVVILVPIMLFLLGVPNKPPRAAESNDKEARAAQAEREAKDTTRMIALDDWSRLGLLAALANENAVGESTPIGFKKLVESVDDPAEQAHLEGKTVELRGQYSPDPRDPRFFSLVRFRVQCCPGDAVDKRISVFSKEPITSVNRDAWVKVVGKVEYARRGDVTLIRLATPGPSAVTPCNPDTNPYLQ